MKQKLFVGLIKYKLNLNLLALSIFIAASSLITAQENFVFENLSIPEGLSNPTINCIYEDKYGFLWFGTNDGLTRYDGYEFKVYRNNPSDSSSLPGNIIHTINEDKNGNLWIGGNNVLVKYDRKRNKFDKVKFDREQTLNQPRITKIFIDNKNRIWLGTAFFGVHLLNPREMITKRIKFTLNFEEIKNKPIFSIIETSDREVLALRYAEGVFYYNEADSVFQLFHDLRSEKAGANLLVLYEDEFNRLWIGGEESLVIYDRNNDNLKKVKLFSNYNSTLLTEGTITNLKEQTELFSALRSSFLTGGIINILKDKAGYLWLATLDKGLYRYSPVDNSFFHFTKNGNNKNSIKSAGILSLFQDSFGNVWIGTRLAGLYKIDPNKQPMNVLTIPENLRTNSTADAIISVAIDEKGGNIAIGTDGLGLFWQNIRSGAYKNYRFNENSNSISSNKIVSLTTDSDNNLWIGSNAGLDKLNPISGKVNKYFSDKTSLYTTFYINELKFDKTGRLFVAHRGGVDILYPNQNIVKTIPTVLNRKLKAKLQSDIIELANSSHPIASILKVGEKKLLEKEFELTESVKVIIIGVGEGNTSLEKLFDFGWLEDADGKLLWGMEKFRDSFQFQGGFKNRIMIKTLKLNKGKYKLRYRSDEGHSYGNFNVTAPKDSSLWGIQIVPVNDEQFTDFSARIRETRENSSEMLMAYATSIYISKSYENILWIGTESQGLFKYNLNDGKFIQYNNNITAVTDFQSNNDVYFVYEDSRGIVWFSSPNGLGRLNPKTEKIIFFTEKDGLPTNLISAIQEDNYGNLWISSAAGLTSMVRNAEGKKETFINIDIKDGLQGYSYSRATWKTSKGELFFGGDNGVNYFIPGRTNQTKPKIVFTDFKISDISVFKDLKNSPLKKDLNDTKNLTLNYSQNDIAFQFAPIHYSRPERNLIAYKLEGFNEDWVYSKLHFASFTNLEPGEYAFKLKAANGDGIWSDEEKSIHIEVLPPYWRTTFAYIGYGILLVLTFFVVDRFQRKRLIRKAGEKMRIQEAEHRAEAAELQAKAAEAQAKLIQADNERKTEELEEARKLQLSMLPKELPNLPNLDIAVYMQTATEVGGDYYDFRVESDGTLNAALGDATGHGMQAGTLVTIMKGIFTTEAEKNDVLSFFDKSNRALKEINLDRLMMAFAFLKIKDNRLTLANAGIPPVYIYRSKTEKLEKIDNKGMPLGAMKNFPYKETKAELHTGDVIFLLSDGFPELFNERKEMFGYERVEKTFIEVADRSPEKIIERLKETAMDWAGGNAPDDDVTFVVLKMK